MTPRLAFPAYAIETRDEGGKLFVRDPIRRRWVRGTPEEWVRQHLLRYLGDLGYAPGLLAVEKGFPYGGKLWRADVVAYGRTGQALLLAECKAPEVTVTQATFDQLARYNAVVRAHALVVTNGLVHYCCVADAGGWQFVEAIPAAADLNP
ncbi:MAG TPA: type I restriction enzyme HsdR N-terminal domain-containing protein [Rubricoccaceae bacterium]|nr:type I restriction enzyme HsdR N-terminal domain-containing protein [Rubricoccaceae bacterium]